MGLRKSFGGQIRSSEAAMGAQHPVWQGNEPKKTGARSARAHARGQNPLVMQYLVTFNFLENFKALNRPEDNICFHKITFGPT